MSTDILYIRALFSGMYTKLLNEHRIAQGLERMKLAKHREKCYKNPEKYLGICIDGMDQKKTELPHFLRIPKNMDEKYFIAVHVVGCLVINGTLKSKVFLNYPNIHNDSNLTIHAVQHVLNTWEGPLPPVLYVQLDNTSRENKNKFTMAYFNMLVEKGIFKKIKIGFLVVGHTHDQIDQMFSRFSVKLNRQRAFRLDSLKEIIVDSYTPKPEIIFVDQVADFKKFVSNRDQPNDVQMSRNVLETLYGIREQKQFRIKEVVGPDGFTKTEFHAKHLSTTEDWGKVVPFLRYIPTSPMWVASQMALKCARGKSGKEEENDPWNDEGDNVVQSRVLEKYQKAIAEGYTYFSDQDILWWREFFRKQEDILLHQLEPARWRFEWTWPAPSKFVQGTIDDIQTTVPSQLLEKVAGSKKTMYSGKQRALKSFGDYRDLEINMRFAMIYVKAESDPRKKPFWLAKVTKVLTTVEGVPDKIKITWFTIESDDPALEGRYIPERSKSSKTVLEDELCLSKTTVYAYNFALLGNKSIPAVTKRIIAAALLDTDNQQCG